MAHQLRRGRPRRVIEEKVLGRSSQGIIQSEEEVMGKSPEAIIQSALLRDKGIESLKIFYDDYILPYLVSDAGKVDIKIPNVWLKPIKQPSKKALATAIATIWGNRTSFLRFYNTLPEEVKTIFFQVACFGSLSARSLKENFGIIFYQTNQENYYRDVERAYEIFRNSSRYGYSSYTNAYDVDLSKEIKKILREWFKSILPSKLLYAEQSEILADWQRYDIESDGHAPLHVNTLVTYFREVTIQKTATNKISISTLKELKKVAKIQELYKENKGPRAFVMTNLLANLFINLGIKIHYDQPLVILKHILDALFMMPNHITKKIFFSYIYKPNTNFSFDENLQPVLQELQELMRKLEKKVWYSPLHIAQWMYHMNDVFFSYIQSFSVKDLYLDSAIRENDKINFIKKEISFSQIIEVLALPFVRSFFSIMASLGLVEIAYTDPINDEIRVPDEEYLTLFDGIQYVRLTDLGAYFFGQAPTYVYKKEIVESGKTNIELDPDFLMITISKPDSIKEANLSRFAEQVATCRFRADFRSFLKNCTTVEEANERIKDFQRVVEVPITEWPINWLEFIVKIRTRIRPIRAVATYQVFKLDDDPDLLQLFLTDPVLSKLILRAENRHIMVEHAHVSELKGRLGVLGYLMP
ncbi:MAG: hypothetical protein JNN12_07135 [Bacteroidetes Order II. Incertae sedis bacterium]|nr:hypothetical protein [Bacteroidetes Order II. bacterium]